MAEKVVTLHPEKKLSPMEPGEFWEIVHYADWEKHCEDRRGYESSKRLLRRKLLTLESMRRFRLRWMMCQSRLQEEIDWFETDHRRLSISSDDLVHMMSHVIGLGQATFEDELGHKGKLLNRAESRRFVESFLYAIPKAEEYAENYDELRDRRGQQALESRLIEDEVFGILQPMVERLKLEYPDLSETSIDEAVHKGVGRVQI